MNKFIVADITRCIGCHACEVACVTSTTMITGRDGGRTFSRESTLFRKIKRTT
jgi:Fe-S-cluster-containing dehydrogenase component